MIDECEFLHEGHCIVEVIYPNFVCPFRTKPKDEPDSILWVCTATPDDLIDEEEWLESMTVVNEP